MPRPGSQAWDPVDRATARRAVKHELSELPLKIALHVQKLEPEHLGVNGDRVRSTSARGQDLVDEVVSLDRLLDHRADGVLEEVALPSCHAAILERGDVALDRLRDPPRNRRRVLHDKDRCRRP